jgi:glycosyltransferase involved in cell wall biosynthesis
MRVLHVESGRHRYGGAEQVRYLVADLARAGVSNALACPAGSALATAVPDADIFELPMAGDADVALLPRLIALMRRLRPHLVHVHSRRGADIYAGLAARRCALPAVLTRRVESVEPAWLMRIKCRPYAAVIAISQAIERDLVDRIGLAPPRVHHIASAVDTLLYRPHPVSTAKRAALGLPAAGPCIAVVAQLVERKGHTVLLHALTELVTELPALKVVCFGQGPLLARLAAEVRSLGLAEHVRFLGYRADLPTWLPQFDLLVHPALREGLGVALLEAHSAGVPVVASAVGGIREVVADGESGCLVPPGDPGALAATIRGLLADPARRSRMGAAGRAMAEQRFAADRLAAAHLPLYEALRHA